MSRSPSAVMLLSTCGRRGCVCTKRVEVTISERRDALATWRQLPTVGPLLGGHKRHDHFSVRASWSRSPSAVMLLSTCRAVTETCDVVLSRSPSAVMLLFSVRAGGRPRRALSHGLRAPRCSCSHVHLRHLRHLRRLVTVSERRDALVHMFRASELGLVSPTSRSPSAAMLLFTSATHDMFQLRVTVSERRDALVHSSESIP